jgi:hypothetical protein
MESAPAAPTEQRTGPVNKATRAPLAKKATKTVKRAPARKAAKRTVKGRPGKKATRKTVGAKRTVGRKAPAKKVAAKKMSATHKRALAAGREEARHVRAYLDALAAHRPRRGRQRTEATVRKQLAHVESELRGATGFRKLELVARRIDLQTELASKQGRSDLTALRKNFVKHAGRYARRKGIPKQAFQEAGVPPADIREAGIK